jgi:adenine-specific DNA-methyltransferase
MPRPRKAKLPADAVPVTSYKHTETRARIPTQEESEKLSAKEKRPTKKAYQYDPSMDPQLVWAGKAEAGAEFGVPTVPIYVQEKVSPEAIVARLRQGADPTDLTLFGSSAADQFQGAVDFYKHEDNWQNRLVLGDSLLVMNSLLEKEGMRGRVQCVYIDPPYGIKFGSNWQVSTRKRDVKDNKVEDFVRQPEQVKAFRDTWELGVHSYLSYLRDRLITARELLTESGSCFVQISEDNLHHVREVMDEVFGSENYCSTIIYHKTAGLADKLLSTVTDIILWYAKDKKIVKYRQLYLEKKGGNSGSGVYSWVELNNSSRRRMTAEERIGSAELPPQSRVFRLDNLTSQGDGGENSKPIELDGKFFECGKDRHWTVPIRFMRRLIDIGRAVPSGKSLAYVRYLDDFPVTPVNNVWADTGTGSFTEEKIYVVQSGTKAVQRCLLMTTDPGDIVLDPTCGSGTTAYVAEQWGRRWITTDTSRVALALARTRLMTAKFPYYRLKEAKNIRAGFDYKTVPHVTLKSIANNEPAEQEVLYDQPFENKEKVRVAGPFTVESLSPHRVSDAQEMLSSERFVETIVENLRKAGVQTGERGARVEFANLDILPGGPEIQASGEYVTEDGLKKVAVAIGPEFGSVDDDFVRAAANTAARFADLLIVAATSFEASAFAEGAKSDKVRVMKVKINPDLSMGDLLKKTGAGNLFLAFGEPEVRVSVAKDGYSVEVLGVDVYDPVRSEIRSSGSGDPEHDIAAWFVDTNYDGQSFFVTQAYFLGADKPYEKLKKALKASIDEDVWESLYTTVSRPFPKPTTGKIAVKVINHYGDEVMKIVQV